MKAIDRIAAFVAMGCGIGHVPRAPGTFGSLPGLLVGWGIHAFVARMVGGGVIGGGVTVLLLTAVVGVAFAAIARTERVLKIHDDQRIVVDEVAGQAIAVAFVTPTVTLYLAGFLLFRLLDIAKPSLIGKIDREVTGAWGTLGDDVLAGIVAVPFVYGLSIVLGA